jgi:capsular polysaccharide biosynthesis protein
MEIRDYLRAIRRILPLLIILPIVAAAITGFFLEKQPSKYEATATVVVPAISGNGTSQSAASQYVDTFKDVLVSEQVVPNVSQKFKIPVSELVAGLSADTVTASSNIIHVTLVGLDHQNLTGAVREATVESMDAIARPSVTEAENEVTNSQTLLTNAQTAINNFIAAKNNADPPTTFANAQKQLNNEIAELQLFTLNGDKAKAAQMTTTIAAQRQVVETAGQDLQQWQSLSDAQAAAISANNHAQTALVSAQSLVKTDEDPSTVTVVNNGRLSKLSDVIKFAGIAFALALLMLLGLILILELMRSGRRPATTVATEQGSFAWASAPPASSQAETSAPMAPAPAGSPRELWPGGSPPPSPGTVASGNGNGNGHSEVPDATGGSEQAESGILRRR